MVRIHPDPPGDFPNCVPVERFGRELRGCSSVGRAPALQAGGHRFDPVQLHQIYRLRQRSTFVVGPVSATSVESCKCSLTIREGKASIGLDESWIDDRVELYLVRAL